MMTKQPAINMKKGCIVTGYKTDNELLGEILAELKNNRSEEDSE